MALLEDIVSRIAFLQKEIVDKDQRIRRLESDLEKFLLSMSASGSSAGKTNENSEEATIEDDANGWIVGPRIHSISCENDVGHQFDNPAPMDHKHQGIFGLTVVQCDGVGLFDTHVGKPTFRPLPTDSLGMLFAVGQSVDDQKGQTPDKGGAVNPNWEPTYCDSGITIAHIYNQWVAEEVVGVGAELPCSTELKDAGCDSMAKFPIDWVYDDADTDCEEMYFPIKLNVDCNGHLTDGSIYLFKRMTFNELVPDSPDNVIPCDTNVDVFAPYVRAEPDPDFPPTGIDCDEDVTNVSGRWRLTLYKKTLCIPCDAWSPTEPPTDPQGDAPTGPCDSGKVLVVTGITVTAKPSVDCGKDITVTYGCVSTGGTAPTTTVDVVTTVCYDSSSCQIKVKKTQITVWAKGTEGAENPIGIC